MANLSLRINGRAHQVGADPECPLHVLRDDIGLNNPRFGCGLGQCGACTALINQTPIRSCTLPVSRVIGKDITTLGGWEPRNIHMRFRWRSSRSRLSSVATA